jgi:DNA-binding NtrC family response regulator
MKVGVMARVLMVGGLPSLRLLYFFQLTRLGCDVISARKFSEALRLLEIDYRFQVMFVNLNPPLDAGLAFIDFIHKVYPSMPLVITAPESTESSGALDALKARNLHFYRPTSISDLEPILEALHLLKHPSEMTSGDTQP